MKGLKMAEAGEASHWSSHRPIGNKYGLETGVVAGEAKGQTKKLKVLPKIACNYSIMHIPVIYI